MNSQRNASQRHATHRERGPSGPLSYCCTDHSDRFAIDCYALAALPLRGAAPSKALLDLPRGLCAAKGRVALFLVVALIGKFSFYGKIFKICFFVIFSHISFVAFPLLFSPLFSSSIFLIKMKRIRSQA